MFRLVAGSLDPDLEFPLLANKSFCLVHIHTGQFNPDVLCDIPHAGHDYLPARPDIDALYY